MLAANPGAKLVMIQLAGHLPNPEKSEGCIEAVRDFLKQFCLGWRWGPYRRGHSVERNRVPIVFRVTARDPETLQTMYS